MAAYGGLVVPSHGDSNASLYFFRVIVEGPGPAPPDGDLEDNVVTVDGVLGLSKLPGAVFYVEMPSVDLDKLVAVKEVY